MINGSARLRKHNEDVTFAGKECRGREAVIVCCRARLQAQFPAIQRKALIAPIEQFDPIGVTATVKIEPYIRVDREKFVDDGNARNRSRGLLHNRRLRLGAAAAQSGPKYTA